MRPRDPDLINRSISEGGVILVVVGQAFQAEYTTCKGTKVTECLVHAIKEKKASVANDQGWRKRMVRDERLRDLRNRKIILPALKICCENCVTYSV
jgi:hypothetical protein